MFTLRASRRGPLEARGRQTWTPELQNRTCIARPSGGISAAPSFGRPVLGEASVILVSGEASVTRGGLGIRGFVALCQWNDDFEETEPINIRNLHKIVPRSSKMEAWGSQNRALQPPK